MVPVWASSQARVVVWRSVPNALESVFRGAPSGFGLTLYINAYNAIFWCAGAATQQTYCLVHLWTLTFPSFLQLLYILVATLLLHLLSTEQICIYSNTARLDRARSHPVVCQAGCSGACRA